MVKQFAVGGMVDGMNTNQAPANLRGVLIDVFQQLVLGARRTNQQPFGSAGQAVGCAGTLQQRVFPTRRMTPHRTGALPARS